MTTKSKTIADGQANKPAGRTLLRPEEFASAIPREWLVEEVLLADNPAVLAGGRLDLTGFAVDLAVSLATGTPFLGHFPVPRRRRVALYCDMGRKDLKAQAELVAAARRTDLTAGMLSPGVRMPAFRTRLGWEATVAEARREGIEVVVIDPVLRALRAGGDGSPPELYEADRLAAVGDAFLDAGVTPVFAHRTGWEGKDVGIAGLGSAGLNDYARQWLLIRRLLPVARCGPGAFRLTAGGLAGHDGVWCVRVTEGRLRCDFSGRTWNVVVTEGTDPLNPSPRANMIATEDYDQQIIDDSYRPPRDKKRAKANGPLQPR